MNQFTQDYSSLGLMMQRYAKRYGEIRVINPFYENFISPTSIDTDQDELVFIVQAGFDLLDLLSVGRFDVFFGDQPGEDYRVITEVVTVDGTNTYFQNNSIIQNRFVKAIRNGVNIDYAYVLGYSIRFTENVFNLIP